MILLDANIVSEAMRPAPEPRVVRWFDRQPPATLFLCAPVVAELRFGLASLPAGGRRERLEGPARRRAGRPLDPADAMIAAIALARGMTLAMRNVGDFFDLGLPLVDPFAIEAP